MRNAIVLALVAATALLCGAGIVKALNHTPPVVTVSFCDTPGPAGCSHWVRYNPVTGACRVSGSAPGQPAYEVACEDAVTMAGG